MSEFSITFSNENSSYISTQNNIGNFRIHPETEINFSGKKWEVALSQISYPNSWYNVPESSTFTIYLEALRVIQTERAQEINNDDYWRTLREIEVVLPKGLYAGTEDLLANIFETVGNEIDKIKHPPKYGDTMYQYTGTEPHVRKMMNEFVFQWNGNPESEFIGFTSKDAFTIFYVPEDEKIFIVDIRTWFPESRPKTRTRFVINSGISMWHSLGFTQFKLNESISLPLENKGKPAISSNNPIMLIAAPGLIQPQFVGDTLFPILDMVPVERNTLEDVITFRQDHPLYKKVFSGYINDIAIHITDSSNNIISFASGKIQLTLNFRPCRSTNNLEKV